MIMNASILSTFVGKKAEYYLNAFERIAARKTVWNWAAFLLGIGWRCYRGMYRYAMIIGIFIIVESAIEVIFMLPDSISNGVTIGIWVASGLLGNTLYKMHCDKQISMIESLPLSEDECLAIAAAKGKTSMLMGFLGFFIFMVVLFGVLFLLQDPTVDL